MKRAIAKTNQKGIRPADPPDMFSGDGSSCACRRPEADLNAVISGCFETGADAVRYADVHGAVREIRVTLRPHDGVLMELKRGETA